MSLTHWEMLLYFSYWLYPVSDPTKEEAGRWARLIEICCYISAIDYIQFLIQQKKKQEDELDSLRNVVIFQLLTLSSFWSNRRRSRKMSSTHWEMLLYFSYWLYPVSDPTEEEAGRWVWLTEKCYYISAVDYIQFLIQQKKKQEDELDSLRYVVIFQLLTISSFWSNRRRSRKMSSTHWDMLLYFSYWLPYNGIFLRRQIFVVLSKKHGAYFSRILIFVVGNVCEKWFWFVSAKIVEWVAKHDFPSIDQLCGEEISNQSVWNGRNKRYLNKQKGHIFIQMVEKKWLSEQYNETSVLLACDLNPENRVIRHFLP